MNYSVHKKIPVFLLICELEVRVKLYKATCSIIDCWKRRKITYMYM
jgi:hypothetical protein